MGQGSKGAYRPVIRAVARRSLRACVGLVNALCAGRLSGLSEARRRRRAPSARTGGVSVNGGDRGCARVVAHHRGQADEEPLAPRHRHARPACREMGLQRYRDTCAAADASRRSRATGRRCATLKVAGESYSPLHATPGALPACHGIAIARRQARCRIHAIATGSLPHRWLMRARRPVSLRGIMRTSTETTHA